MIARTLIDPTPCTPPIPALEILGSVSLAAGVVLAAVALLLFLFVWRRKSLEQGYPRALGRAVVAAAALAAAAFLIAIVMSVGRC